MYTVSQEVVAFVHKCAQGGMCPRQAASELVKEARKRWVMWPEHSSEPQLQGRWWNAAGEDAEHWGPQWGVTVG
jgi:hypothetical protein